MVVFFSDGSNLFSSMATLQMEGRHAVIKTRRAFGMKTAVKDSERCNIAAVRMRLKTPSYTRPLPYQYKNDNKSNLIYSHSNNLNWVKVQITS